MSLDHCEATCKKFVRESLPLFRDIEANLHTIPKFTAVTERRGKRRNTRFNEGTQPDWHRVPRDVLLSALSVEAGRACVHSLETTKPFSGVMNRRLMNLSSDLHHATDLVWLIDGAFIANEILVNYLFAAGSGRWKPEIFDQIWSQCADYFDLRNDQIKCTIYAPIWGVGNHRKKLPLTDGLEIQWLSPNHVAQLASRDTNLAGRVLQPEGRLWTSSFFVKEISLKKPIGSENDFGIGDGLSVPEIQLAIPNKMERLYWQHVAWMNLEVIILRALLHQYNVASIFVLVNTGFPRAQNHGHITSLPWTPYLLKAYGNAPSRQRLLQYAKSRDSFLRLKDRQGWSEVAVSMRRFAIAWENTFAADVLADIVAALEALLVRSNTEVSYKLRARAASFLAQNQSNRKTIFDDIKMAYEYRSRIAHGSYVFDDIREYEAAPTLWIASRKLGKRYHDFDEVARLTHTLTSYYRAALMKMIRSEELTIDWPARGL